MPVKTPVFPWEASRGMSIEVLLPVGGVLEVGGLVHTGAKSAFQEMSSQCLKKVEVLLFKTFLTVNPV